MSSNFSVVALIAAYNEGDIIEQVITDLIRQGVGVYFMDDGSTDGTLAIVGRHLGHGVIAIEQLSESLGSGSNDHFQWARILERKALVASRLDANWFIHHDADEFRESPWFGESLRDAIHRVDTLGYNAIDWARFDFWPVDDHFRPGDDVRAALPFYAEPAPYNRQQVRCWKRTQDPVDLASSGGHDVRFPNRRVFPVRFILRHYAIRGQQHGQRKIAERRARFLDEERARGWHVQYDDVDGAGSLLHNSSHLTRYDGNTIRADLLLRHRWLEESEALRERETAELSRLRNDLATRMAEIQHCSEQLSQLVTRVETATAEAEHLRRALEQATQRLNELHRSLSWRWTSPARAAYRALRKVGS